MRKKSPSAKISLGHQFGAPGAPANSILSRVALPVAVQTQETGPWLAHLNRDVSAPGPKEGPGAVVTDDEAVLGHDRAQLVAAGDISLMIGWHTVEQGRGAKVGLVEVFGSRVAALDLGERVTKRRAPALWDVDHPVTRPKWRGVTHRAPFGGS